MRLQLLLRRACQYFGYTRNQNCSVKVRPKVRVRELLRILTSLKSAVRSSVKVRRTFIISSNFTAFSVKIARDSSTPPVQSHSFLAVKVTNSIYI